MAFIVWGITFCDTPKITIHAALSSFTCTLKQRETLTCPHCPGEVLACLLTLSSSSVSIIIISPSIRHIQGRTSVHSSEISRIVLRILSTFGRK